MSLFAKIQAMITGASSVDKAIGSAIGHFAIGDVKDGIADVLTLLVLESQSHPAVVAAVSQVQAVLAANGLAHPVAPVAATPQVAPVVVTETPPAIAEPVTV